MKKLLIMVSALTAAVFSSAKADVSVSGSAGVHVPQVETLLTVIATLLQVHYL
jgi:hypothetical protein